MLESSSANLSADLSLKPKGSQTLLVVAAAVSALCLFTSFYFAWERHPATWLPLVVGALLGIVTGIGWNKSRVQVDYQNPLATSIIDKNSGIELRTDSRALAHVDSLRELGDIITSLANRQPLPKPSGLVNSDGSPVPESQEEAQARVDAANEEAERLTAATVEAFSPSSPKCEIRQPPISERGNFLPKR